MIRASTARISSSSASPIPPSGRRMGVVLGGRHREGVARPPGFREFTHFTIVTYGPFALREGVTAPRRSTPTASDRTLLLACRLEGAPAAPPAARPRSEQPPI